MPEWILKIFDLIVSVKTAWIAVLTSCGLVLGWEAGTTFITGEGVPNSLAPYLLFFTIYGLSHILVDAGYKARDKITEALTRHKKKKVRKQNREAFIANARIAVPLLPGSQLNVLSDLSEKNQRLNIKKSEVSDLSRQQYINQLHSVSLFEYVFEIDPDIKEIVLSHFSLLRRQYISDSISNMTDHQKEFLSLYFSEVVSQGTEESDTHMEPEVFRAGESMSNNGLLERLKQPTQKRHIEAFRLPEDLAKELADKVFDQAPVRDELHLNSKYIIGSYASGSGFRG